MESNLAVTAPQNAMEMIASVVQRANITQESVAALGELIKLQTWMEDRAAMKDFDAAMAALQADIPIITASTIIPNRGKYERFEDLMRVLKPLLTKHGFTVTFSMDVKENRVVETCHLSRAGHTRSNSFAVRTGRCADSETQADCKAATTAKRLALCNALNLIIRQDVDQEDAEGDARLDGDMSPVSDDQSEHIKQRIQEVRADVVGFLRVFQVQTVGNIPASKYKYALELLDKKEAQNQRQKVSQ